MLRKILCVNKYKFLYNNIISYIFSKKINSVYKLVPFNGHAYNHVGKTKYLPPVSKEWKNSVYNFNSNNFVNYPLYDLKINYLIKTYFNLYFSPKFLQRKYKSPIKRIKSNNKIFVSKAEIKHTNSKSIITIYVYNRERFILLKKINILKKYLFKYFSVILKKMILSRRIKSNNLTKDSSFLWKLAKYKVVKDKLKLNQKRRRILYKAIRYCIIILYRILRRIRNLRLRLSLNKYKFEEIFLYRLSKLISKFYGKKVEFNIVNLKSVAFNVDIFTEIIMKRLNKRSPSSARVFNSILGKTKIVKENNIKERGRIQKGVDFELIQNKYIYPNISYILHNKNPFNYSLNKLLYNLYYDRAQDKKDNKLTILPNQNSIRKIIFENIKYKNLGGIRLSVKGRLTKRYRADRSVSTLKWKGGLKDIDSAFKGLSTVVYRGYLGPNVEKSMLSGIRHIGSFALKGWISGK